MSDKEKQTKTTALIKVVRPYLRRDGGDLEFVKLENDICYVRFLGACSSCGLSGNTFDGVKNLLLEELPFLTGVELV